MAAFVYEVLDENGRKRSGVLEGDSARQVRQQLRDKGWTPLSVEASLEKEQRRQSSGFMARSISAADLALVTRQLATLIRAGLPVEEALRAVSRQSEQQRISSMMLAVRAKVVEGHTLAWALEQFPGSFPELYRATVAAGEKSGHLDLVLEQLADYTERRYDLLRTVRGALIYPIVLVLFSVLIVGVLLTVAVPKIVAVFERTKQELPVPTQILIAVSDFMASWWWAVAAAAALGIFLFVQAMREDAFRRRVHAFLLRAPLVRRLVRGADAARFASTLSILMASGVPLVEALRISGQVTTNLLIRDAVNHASVKVQEGASLNRSLDQGGYFPPMMIQMIASGENSGELDTMLSRAALAQEKDLQVTISAFLALFGPLVLVLMAVLVFGIVIAMLLPIINMNNMVG
ncbi:MAG: type II secretion system inner membrane protein GspF [Pseudomonadota bacterium]